MENPLTSCRVGCGALFRHKTVLAKHEKVCPAKKEKQKPSTANANYSSQNNNENAAKEGDKSEEEEELLCTKCGMVFSKEVDLIKHVAAHDANDAKNTSIFTCKYPFCTHFFSHAEDLGLHVSCKHVKVKMEKFEREKTERKKVAESPELIAIADDDEGGDNIAQDYEDEEFIPNEFLAVVEDVEMDQSPADLLEVKYQPTSAIGQIGSQQNLNPFVFISKECRDIADAALRTQFQSQEDNEEQNLFNPLFQATPSSSNAGPPKLSDSGQDLTLSSILSSAPAIPPTPGDGGEIPNTPTFNLNFYICHVCESVGVQKTFATRLAYTVHINYHKKTGRAILRTPAAFSIPVQDTYSCEKCEGRVFTDRKKYLYHLKLHRRHQKTGGDKTIPERKLWTDIPYQDEYKCPEESCNGRLFQKRVSYISHLKYHQSGYKRKDRKSDSSSTPRRGRNFRLRADVPLQDVYTCDKCEGKQFTKRPHFLIHLREHRKKEMIAEKKRMRLERIRPDIPMQDEYQCETCFGRKFTERMTYISHIRYHEQIVKREGQDRPIAEGSTGTVRNVREDIPMQDEYECGICPGRKFDDRKMYITHLNYHEKIKEKEGKDRAIGAGDTQVNWRSQIPFKDSYTCDTCPGRTFVTRESYIGHVATHRNLEQKGCNRRIMSREEHYKKIRKENGVDGEDDDESETKEYFCSTCDRKFTHRRQYIGHKAYHRQLKKLGKDRKIGGKPVGNLTSSGWRKEIPVQDVYTCESCPHRSFHNRASYIGHLAYHKSLKRMKCDRPILSKEDLSGKGNFTCKICNDGTVYETTRDFLSHHRKVHMKKRRARRRERDDLEDDDGISRNCDLCQRTFEGKKAFRLHERAHTIIRRKEGQDRPIKSAQQLMEARNIKCEICPDRIFNKRLNFRMHMRSHEMQEQKYGKAFPLRRKGQQSSVPLQDEYRCEKCPGDRVWQDRKRFLQHWRFHNKAKTETPGNSGPTKPRSSAPPASIPFQYTCHCGERFHFLDALEFHIGNVHKNGMPIVKCGFCDAEFLEKEMLKDHMKQRHGIDNSETIKKKPGPKRRKKQVEEMSADNNTEEISNSVIKAEEDIENQTTLSQPMDFVVVKFEETEHDEEGEHNNMNPLSSEEQMIYFTDPKNIIETETAESSGNENKSLSKEMPSSASSTTREIPVAKVQPTKAVQEKDDQLYECSCLAIFTGLAAFLRHQIAFHPKEPGYSCPVCASRIDSLLGLIIHSKSEHSLSGEMFKTACPKCAESLSINNERDARNHYKKEHPDLICKQCGTLCFSGRKEIRTHRALCQNK